MRLTPSTKYFTSTVDGSLFLRDVVRYFRWAIDNDVDGGTAYSDSVRFYPASRDEGTAEVFLSYSDGCISLHTLPYRAFHGTTRPRMAFTVYLEGTNVDTVEGFMDSGEFSIISWPRYTTDTSRDLSDIFYSLMETYGLEPESQYDYIHGIALMNDALITEMEESSLLHGRVPSSRIVDGEGISISPSIVDLDPLDIA